MNTVCPGPKANMQLHSLQGPSFLQSFCSAGLKFSLLSWLQGLWGQGENGAELPDYSRDSFPEWGEGIQDRQLYVDNMHIINFHILNDYPSYFSRKYCNFPFNL